MGLSFSNGGSTILPLQRLKRIYLMANPHPESFQANGDGGDDDGEKFKDVKLEISPDAVSQDSQEAAVTDPGGCAFHFLKGPFFGLAPSKL